MFCNINTCDSVLLPDVATATCDDRGGRTGDEGEDVCPGLSCMSADMAGM